MRLFLNAPRFSGLPVIDTAVPSPLREVHDFGSNPGNLRAWLHVPDALAPSPALVVVLHGCTQTAAGYDHGAGWSSLADAEGFVVLYPEQQRANNPNGCFNWFVPADTARGSGEALSIKQMIDTAVSRCGIDPEQIFITGLSAGGAMASVMLAAYPETFAAGAIIAGLPYGIAATVPQAFERMRGEGGKRGADLSAHVRAASDHEGPWPVVSVWHGSADATVNPANADLIVQQWLPLHDVRGPGTRDVVDGQARTSWRDRHGRVVVEQYTLARMGHGTPLATRGPDGCGAAGPFMLEAGISSTRHIARSWGLLGPQQAGIRPIPAVARREQRARPMVPANGPGAVIERALRAAGLLR